MALKSPVTGMDWALADSSNTDGSDDDNSDTSRRSDWGLQFNTRLHAVDDLGMDPDGNEPIDSRLPTNRDYTVIEFPAGDYLIEDYQLVENRTNWGICGLGETPSDVQFHAPNGKWLKAFIIRGGIGVLLDNVTFQQSDDHVTGIMARVSASDNVEVHNVHWDGYTPTMNDNDALKSYAYSLNVAATAPDGIANVSGLVNTTGADVVDYPGGTIPVFSGSSCDGTVNFSNIHIENSSSHSLYVSKASSINVTNSVIKNCVNTNMRLSGDFKFTNSHIVVDADKNQFRETETGEYQRVRGLWVENQKTGASGGRVENCTFTFDCDIHSIANWDTGCIHINGSVGGITIINNDFVNTTTDTPNILVEEVGSGARNNVPDTTWVRGSGNTISGGGSYPLVTNNRSRGDVTIT